MGFEILPSCVTLSKYEAATRILDLVACVRNDPSIIDSVRAIEGYPPWLDNFDPDAMEDSAHTAFLESFGISNEGLSTRQKWTIAVLLAYFIFKKYFDTMRTTKSTLDGLKVTVRKNAARLAARFEVERVPKFIGKIPLTRYINDMVNIGVGVRQILNAEVTLTSTDQLFSVVYGKTSFRRSAGNTKIALPGPTTMAVNDTYASLIGYSTPAEMAAAIRSCMDVFDQAYASYEIVEQKAKDAKADKSADKVEQPQERDREHEQVLRAALSCMQTYFDDCKQLGDMAIEAVWTYYEE